MHSAPAPYNPHTQEVPPAAGFNVPSGSVAPQGAPGLPYPVVSHQAMPAPTPVVVAAEPARVDHVVVIQQPAAPSTTIIVQEVLPSHPTLVHCPNCNHRVTTRVHYHPTCRTHTWALIMCLFILWPFCLIPYCIKGCKRADHHCPRCNFHIGASM